MWATRITTHHRNLHYFFLLFSSFYTYDYFPHSRSPSSPVFVSLLDPWHPADRTVCPEVRYVEESRRIGNSSTPHIHRSISCQCGVGPHRWMIFREHISMDSASVRFMKPPSLSVQRRRSQLCLHITSHRTSSSQLELDHIKLRSRLLQIAGIEKAVRYGMAVLLGWWRNIGLWSVRVHPPLSNY